MRTIVYVDGFNLYHRRLKGTPYKWLNLGLLFENILEDHHDIVLVRYFTAHLKQSSHDPDSQNRQKAYLAALNTCSNLEIHLGKFSVSKIPMYLDDPSILRSQRDNPALVVKREEKRSDVNFAVNLINDAWMDAFDSAVIVTDDTDMLEALKLVKKQFPSKSLYLISPQGKSPTILGDLVDFRLRLSAANLVAAQFANPVLRPRKSPIYKPDSW